MTVDPTGAHGMRPDAGRRTDPDARMSSEWLSGGLMAIGTRVAVTVPQPNGNAQLYTGTIADRGNVPAALLVLRDVEHPWVHGDKVVIFLGPGTTISAAPPTHPGQL